VRKLFLKAFGLFACFAWTGMAFAVGFGGINITSSLGKPLHAEIELVSVEQADKASLVARLATPNAFKGAGIDYPYTLPKMTFAVENRANGESYVKVSTTQAVNEPFVSLLIELSWASGRLLREYTFLLDPPGFVAEQPAVVAVAPIAPVVAAVKPAPVAVPVPVVVPEPVVESAPEVVTEPTPAVQEKIEEAPAEEKIKPKEPIETSELPPAKDDAVVPVEPVTVVYGDTLGKIAVKAKASNVSLERMLVALYRANEGAFSGHNMNRLRTGKVLRMPKADELANIQQLEAVKEVHAQVVDWNAYRQKLAAATALSANQGADQEVSGKISTAVVDKTAEAKEPAKEVLKLSKGDAPGDQTTTGGKTKADRANSKEENAVAKAKSLEEAAQRTALLEKNIKDMQRLVALKNEAAAKAAQAASSVTPAASTMVVAKPIAPKVIVAPPSLMDEVLENPVLLGGGAAALLGLLGLIMMRKRKTVSAKPASKDKGSATGRITAPVAPSPETGDFTSQSTLDTIATTTDDVDPIAEADMFLSFGRDVQAEEVLKDALSKDPSSNPIKLKLLSIYVDRKDSKSLYVYAMEIKESGDEAAWAQAAAMGLALEPHNAVYGGSADEAIAPTEEDAALPAVDFDLSMAGEEEDQVAATVDLDNILEDIGEKTAIISESEMLAAQEAVMDFDVTSTHSESAAVEEGEPVLDVAAMDFDIGEIEEPRLDMVVASEEKAEVIPVDSAADESKFDMDSMEFDAAVVPEAIAEPVPTDAADEDSSLNLEDLVFEMPVELTPSAVESAPVVEESAPVAEELAPVAEEVAPVAEEEIAFSIDIPTDEEKPEEVAKPAAQSVDLGEISLSLDDLPDAAAPAAEVKDERWQEVATKLDLAKAYQEMGDQAGASEILEEVVRDGDEKQRATAQDLLQQIT